jgi:glutaryl-CoA transferase
MGPLKGTRVLDLSRILAGPWCTQLLADLGAEVIKVERRGTGDDTREWGPPFIRSAGGERGDSAYFLGTNRGKKSVTIDLGTPAGQELVRCLARHADVLIENYKFGDMQRYGIDYDSVAAINPRLVYCSITGFGQTGPYRERAGYDFMIQAMGGLMSVTGERDDAPGGGPQKCGVPIADIMTGMYASLAIVSALRERDASGHGQHIDMALLDTQVAWLANHALNYLVSGEVPRRWGNAHPNLAPYQAFATQDSHIVLAIGNQGQFRRFCELAGLAIADDARFVDNKARLANRDALVALIAAAMKTRTTAQWMQELEREGVPCGPINTIDQGVAFAEEVGLDPVVRVGEGDGAVPSVRNPIRFSETPPDYRLPPPTLDEHGAEIRKWLAGDG